MKGEPEPKMTERLEAVVEAQREEHDYLVGLHQHEEGKPDIREYPIVSAPFSSPNNNYEA